MSPAPRLSVVVPVHDGAHLLPRTLAALEASDLPRATWELVVVDDGSTDGSGGIAASHADRLAHLGPAPRGPAAARNHGVEAARGELVAFVDADVLVHRDALRRMAEALEADPRVGAVFGAYDDAPLDPGFLSQYRNLLHRYVHLAGAGEAETFWAGCGAVRRSAFLDAGGFDAGRFPRPQIEDIDLGYRLRDRGWRILLRPEIQGKHLKRWTLRGMVRTDLLDRGIPWMRLMSRRGAAGRPGTLNVRWQEKAKTALVGAALLLALAAAVSGEALWLWPAGVALASVLLANLALFRWFRRRRGLAFTLAVVPMNVLYYLVNGGCAAGAWAYDLRDRLRAGLVEGSGGTAASAAAAAPAREGLE